MYGIPERIALVSVVYALAIPIRIDRRFVGTPPEAVHWDRYDAGRARRLR